MAEKNDNQLVKEVLTGQVTSFEILVVRYQKKVFYMVLRMVGEHETAKDLTQDIFLKVYDKMGSFKQEYRFFSWMWRIALNETLTWIRKNPRTASLDQLAELAEEESGSARRESQSELLNQSLQELQPDYRMLLVMKYYDGFSYEEMAEAADLSVEKVRSRLFIAREKLRKTLVLKGFHDYD